MILLKKKFLKYGNHKTIDKFTAFFLSLWKVFIKETSPIFFISIIHVKKKKIKFILNVSF